MLKTYEGVLRNGRIEWTGDAPTDDGRPVRVHVTVLEGPALPRPKREPPPSEPLHQSAGHEEKAAQGRRMAEALERIAAAGGAACFGDPLEWQREERKDRLLPGREEE